MKKIIAGVLFTISCVSCVNLESEMYDTIPEFGISLE